jgi:hypothetical protein
MQAHISAWPIITTSSTRIFFVGELVLLEVGHALARVERDVAGGGSSTPARIFMKVVLPEPLAPIRP